MVAIIEAKTRSDSVNQSGLIIDMEAKTTWLEESVNMFESLTRRMRGGTLTATRMEHKFRERRLLPAAVLTTAIAVAGATTITVDNPTYFHRDELVYCSETGEAFLMNEDIGGTASATKITVVNISGSGGVTTEIPSGSTLVNLGECHAEGEDIPPAWNVQETDVSTYLSQHDRTNKNTDISIAEESYGAKELAKSRKQFWLEYARARNLMLYMGQQFRETTTATGPRRHGMKGLISWLTPSAVDASVIAGGVTMKTLGLFMRQTKLYSASSPTKVALVGQNAWQTISDYPDGSVQINPGKAQNWGVTLKELNTPFGDLLIGYDPTLSAEYGHADKLAILDPKFVGQLQMQTLPLRLRLNIGNSTDIHNVIDAITGTRGLELKLTELHKWVYGIA